MNRSVYVVPMGGGLYEFPEAHFKVYMSFLLVYDDSQSLPIAAFPESRIVRVYMGEPGKGTAAWSAQKS